MRYAAYFGHHVPAENLARVAADAFGGATILTGRGLWYDDDGTLYDEPSHIVEVYVEDNAPSRDAWQKMVRHHLNKSTEQSALVVLGDAHYLQWRDA